MTDQSDQLDFNQNFVEAARNMRRQAEQAERGRNAALLSAAERAARQCGDLHVAAVLDDCRKAIVIPGTKPCFALWPTKPPPPAPEPMTVEKVIEMLQSEEGDSSKWYNLKCRLRQLVQAQAKRDAEIAIKRRNLNDPNAGGFIAQDILKAAGLDAEVKP